ncbi:MAG: DNA-processing protein DprA [Burkholderiales bacterium]
MNRDPGLASWLQLSLTPGISATALREVLKRFGLPEAALSGPRARLAGLLSPAALAALDSDSVLQATTRALAWVGQAGNRLITLGDDDYPGLLLETTDPPPVLYARGNTGLLARRSLAIVGSRNATAQGVRDAERFARAFSEAGITIVSGLAQGVDAAAHRGGLAAAGSTIAVLGTGCDVSYPKANTQLAERIASEGLLLSEFPLSTPAIPHNFPRRNRLISGLSRGCLVVEAAIASGSLITARSALDQGREVFAIPGSIHSPLSKGCHALIKAGAKLVESAEDVLSELADFRVAGSASTASVVAPRAEGAEPLLACMGHEPMDVDSLCALAGLGAQEIAAELLRLELAGRVAALPGGRYQRVD